MKLVQHFITATLSLGVFALWTHYTPAQDQGSIASAAHNDASLIEVIRADSEKLAVAFNSANAESVARMFLATGELIDETGTIYQGEADIKGLLTALFEKFPGVKLTMNRESIRAVGPAVIEEGTRTLTVANGKHSAQFRYIDVWVKSDAGWRIASHREFTEDPPRTANDYLQSVAWLQGTWINEGADGNVSIRFEWSEDKNFLLGEFAMRDATGATRKSSQRIGWDPRSGQIRSWLFDADGGFSEGVWTIADDEVVIKSTSVNPDGTSASATLTLKQVDQDHFKFTGSERIVAGSRESDFELTITRSLSASGK